MGDMADEAMERVYEGWAAVTDDQQQPKCARCPCHRVPRAGDVCLVCRYQAGESIDSIIGRWRGEK